jgi:hypothetical protein
LGGTGPTVHDLPGAQLFDDQDVLLHPFGILAVSQKIAPLGLAIDKFGNKKPGPDTLFELIAPAGGTEEVREEFAPAYFLQMSDSDKVARKSLEKMRSGLRLTPANEIQHGFEIQKEVNYELSYVSTRTKSSLAAGIYRMVNSLFSVLAPGGSISRNAHAVARRKATIAPAKV